MTTKPLRDPLLTAAKLLLMFFIGVLGFAAIATAIGAPLVLIVQDRVVAEMAAEGIAHGADAIPVVAFVLLGISALLALAVWFLVTLLRIVRSVGEGDPFVPVNANRISRMGWIALGGQFLAVPVGAAVVWLANNFSDERGTLNARVDTDMGFSGSGILLVLVLFILARVFRHGAAMREDLEGTV